MKIFVCSCDKNKDIFYAFHHCMEKYWPDHPEVIYKTETIQNPYYKTISVKCDILKWTKGIRKALSEIDDDKILLIIDDCFIRRPVDILRIDYAIEHLTGNIACFNFEKSFDPLDEETDLIGFKKRKHGSEYEVSLMCGLWDKNKLLKVIKPDSNPWDVEYNQNNCGFDYYINSGDYIIDWGYKTWNPTGLVKGEWCKNIIPFFESEGIEMDYSIRGFKD